ncbi:hypothetical protein N658DRAFT_431793, partial [Parathielavia hyrcaniae]
PRHRYPFDMPLVVHDRLSLRPQGFYGYAFLATRLAQIVILAVLTSLAGQLIGSIARDRQASSGSLVAIVIFASAALVWTLFSWTGYSRRYLPYGGTLSVDLLFLIPLVVIATVVGLPLADANCADVSPNGRLEVAVPPANSVGRIVFPSNGRAACSRLFTVWGLLIAACALFALSALSVAFLLLGERQLNKAVFAVREEPGRGEGGFYGQGMSESSMRLGSTLAPDSGDGRLGASDFNRSATPPRPSIADDRLDLNRPVTVAPTRPGNRAFEGDEVYDTPLGQPAAVRMPPERPGHGF